MKGTANHRPSDRGNRKAPHCRVPGCKICVLRHQYQLTYAEIRVASTLCIGGSYLSNRRLAEWAGCCEETLKSHLQNLSIKVGAYSRTEIALWMIAHGFDWRTTEPKTPEQLAEEARREAAAKDYLAQLDLSEVA